MRGSESIGRDLATYGIGYILAVLLTGLSFGIIYFRLLAPHTALVVILVLALIQVLVHLRCFLHVGLTRSSREDLQLILFSAIIIIAMVAGTFVVIDNLNHRMMM